MILTPLTLQLMKEQNNILNSSSYSRLSIIGNYSTLLLIANGFRFDTSVDILTSILFLESILLYSVFFICLYRNNENFLTCFFNRVFNSKDSKLNRIKNLIFIILFIIDFVIPSDWRIYYQYSILSLAPLILIYGVIGELVINKSDVINISKNISS